MFACVWAFGGTMLVDKTSDYRAAFSKWWTQEWKAVPFPDQVRHWLADLINYGNRT